VNQIRNAAKSTTQQKVISILTAILIGAILGLAAKLVDTPDVNPIFDDIGGRLGVWVFVAALLSVFSYSPRLAAIKVFAFFGSLLTVYYVYTTVVLHFFPKSAIIFWGICGVISPVCAYVMWYARGIGLVSNLIAALPITVLLSEGFKLRHAYLPEHYHYYLIPWLMGIYITMILVLLLTILNNKMRFFKFFVTLAIAVLLSLFTIYFDVFGRIFGGMNGVL